MYQENVMALARKPIIHRSWADTPFLPATDNEPGAPEALLKANRILREHRWPTPFDRTRHEMILGDARDLSAIPTESVHLVVTSPPYFNLKPTLPVRVVVSSVELAITKLSWTSWTAFGESARGFSSPAVEFVVSSVTF